MNWLGQLFARRRMYRDLEDEIQQHLAEKTDALMAEGMSREKAGAGGEARVRECDKDRGAQSRGLDVAGG